MGAAVISAALLASPALGTFTVVTPPTAAATYTAETLVAPTTLTCRWTGASALSLDWTATTSTFPVQQPEKSTNGGAFSALGSTLAWNAITASDGSASTPVSNTYTYQVNAYKGSWISAYTNTKASNACAGTALTSVVAAPATVPLLNGPEAMAWDPSGNMYVMDTGNKCVRKVTPSTAVLAGTITLFAGTCTTSGTADGVANTGRLGTTAEAIAVDASGNVFIADTTNNLIRRVGSDNSLKTIAGDGSAGTAIDTSPATSGRMNKPAGIVVASDGSVYFTDRLNDRIRHLVCNATPCLNSSTWTMSTPAGSTGTLSNPEQLAIDSSDVMYVADRSNHTIRKVTGCATTCAYFAIAGTGASGYTGEGAATSFKLASPQGVAVDSTTHDVYVADASNKRIRKVTQPSYPTNVVGVISTVAGDGTSAYAGDGYPALASQLKIPLGVGFHDAGSGGEVYIADTTNNLIRKIKYPDTATTGVSGGLVFAVAGDVVAAGNGYAGDTGVATWPALISAAGMTTDTYGNIYIADAGDHRVRVLLRTGELMTVAGIGLAGTAGDAGPATAARVDTPHGVALNSSGTLFIADTNNNKIRQVLTPLDATASANTISTVAGTGLVGNTGDAAAATSAKMSGPYDVAVDGTTIAVADTGNCRIRKFTVGGNMTAYVGTSASTCTGNATLTPLASVALNLPKGLFITSGSDMYIADTANHVIRKIASGASSVTDFAGIRGTSGATGDGGAATSATLLSPVTVSVDGSDVYISDGNAKIRRVRSGNISLIMGTGSGGNTGDNGPAAFSAAKMYAGGDAVIVSTDLYVSSIDNIRRVIGPIP